MKRLRKHGFLTRMKKNYSVIARRRQKGRWQLTV
ncbi:MAG: hypothetical protein MRECE_8c041 [Mycoplasmataceae bacterium CE_OT135]|nr:MAG: hypothetical protein MRECE_8c041 [Mycoplasmataceae bacterium CE_OT135]